MPFLVRWPAAIKPGTRSDAIGLNVDFAPTFLDAAGLPASAEMQGRSLLPVLRGRTPAGWRTLDVLPLLPRSRRSQHAGALRRPHAHAQADLLLEEGSVGAVRPRQRSVRAAQPVRRAGQEALTATLKTELARLKREVRDDDQLADVQMPNGVDGPSQSYEASDERDGSGSGSMIIALASPRVASTLDEGLTGSSDSCPKLRPKGARDRVFPGSLSPRSAGTGFRRTCPSIRRSRNGHSRPCAQWARTYTVATILGMEMARRPQGRQIAAVVIDARGQIQGYQTKNQLDPTEDPFYVPGHTRRLFEINGVKFGVAICHEGFRYPETVRWAAVRGAKIVFHPHCTGSDQDGVRLTQWGAAGGPYYEKAMMMRSRENTIYFASVNYALPLPGIGDQSHRPVRRVPGVLTLRAGRRAGAGHRRRGSDRFARHSIRTRAVSGIDASLDRRTGTEEHVAEPRGEDGIRRGTGQQAAPWCPAGRFTSTIAPIAKCPKLARPIGRP